MEAKWPFILILFFFLGLTGYIISQLERSKVMKDWENRRCNLSVMIGSRFFKPDTDPRSPNEFSNENFEFCMKKFTDSFMNLFMPPITALLGKQADLTGGAMGALNQVREVVKRITNAFMSYVSSYLDKFKNGMFELRRIIAYLRLAMGRLMAVVTSTIYIGLSLFSGMLSSIQVVIRVVLIICAIMIAVIIILWFILLPIIPFILTTLTAVVALVVALSVVMSGSIASDAESKKSGFCFAEQTIVRIYRDSGIHDIPIRFTRIGDLLVSEDGKEHRITAIMQMTSKDVNWYELDGIYVAGDHMVKNGEDWIYVKDDPSAKNVSSLSVSSYSPYVYCLNTETRIIPIKGKTRETYFRDWEELEEDDIHGHQEWRRRVFQLLNGSNEVNEKDIIADQPIPLVGKGSLVWTPIGWRRISDLKVGDVIYDRMGKEQSILGVVRGEAVGNNDGEKWTQGGWVCIQDKNIRWERRKDTIKVDEKIKAEGWNLITDTGEWVLLDENGSGEIVCDFTEVGHVRIRELYEWISSRLRILSQ